MPAFQLRPLRRFHGEIYLRPFANGRTRIHRHRNRITVWRVRRTLMREADSPQLRELCSPQNWVRGLGLPHFELPILRGERRHFAEYSKCLKRVCAWYPAPWGLCGLIGEREVHRAWHTRSEVSRRFDHARFSWWPEL